MKKLLFPILLISISTQAQVYVDSTDLNTAVKYFELHITKKPFSTKDCYYVDYGQKDFRERGFDNESQSVHNKDSVKFEKGEFVKLVNYLGEQGWIKDGQRETKSGKELITIVLFRRKE